MLVSSLVCGRDKHPLVDVVEELEDVDHLHQRTFQPVDGVDAARLDVVEELEDEFDEDLERFWTASTGLVLMAEMSPDIVTVLEPATAPLQQHGLQTPNANLQ